ncbi:hypothetical protein ACFVUN_29365 [Kitasatospora griseola]|uniref:hypothetical protein n=1 Tax=Kitasatospora griseola TaxID=2064 RepID=UPI0036DA3268
MADLPHRRGDGHPAEHAHGLRPPASLRRRDTVDAELWNERADALRPFELSVPAHAVVPER